MKTYKLPQRITAIYLLFVLLALATALFSQATFGTIYLVVLASPWALPLTLIVDAINPQLMDVGLGVIGLLGSCVLNAALLYCFTSWATWKLIRVPTLQ